ncbi:hypothetical protein ES703_78415 [subsurface metagenome]
MPCNNSYQFLRHGVVHRAFDDENTASLLGQLGFNNGAHFIKQLGEGGAFGIQRRFAGSLGKGTVMMPDTAPGAQTDDNRLPTAVEMAPGVAHIYELVGIGNQAAYLYLMTSLRLTQIDDIIFVLGIEVKQAAHAMTAGYFVSQDSRQFVLSPHTVYAAGAD